MSALPRLLASLSALAAVAVGAPAAADAASSVTFAASGTTVEITDPGPSHPSVHLTVTSDGTAPVADTKVLLGGDRDTPYDVVGIDGVHDATYAPETAELSTADCTVYDGPLLPTDPVVVAGSSYAVDLPKGEIIDFDSIRADVAVVGRDAACDGPSGYHGVATDYLDDHEPLDGFGWDAPAAPVVAAAGGRRQVTLTFARERGTTYDVFAVVDGVRSADPVAGNLRGQGAAVPLVLDTGADGQALEPGRTYSYQVVATRIFDAQGVTPTSPFSAVVGAATDVAQVVRFGTGPAASGTDRHAQFTWTIDGARDAGDAPFCLLDRTPEGGGTEVPCTTTGASLADVAPGAHTLWVYPSDGEGAFSYAWTVQDPAPVASPPAAPAPGPVVPVVTVRKPGTDRDGDGIFTTWLIGGRAAPAPATPKVVVSGTKVRLALPAAPKGAKAVRVYRAEGKGAFTVVRTVSTKARSFVDAKAQRGHTYTYKIVAVNAVGDQGAASRAVVAKVPGHR